MNFVSATRIAVRSFTGILPLGVAEEFWRLPASPEVLDRLAAQDWRHDLDPAAVERAGKLGQLVIDELQRFGLLRPGPGLRHHCELYRYATPGEPLERIATGSYDEVCRVLRSRMERYELHYWPGHPYELASFADDPRAWAEGGYAIRPLGGEILAIPSDRRLDRAS